MLNNLQRHLWFMLLLPLLISCAASNYSKGKKELGRENYDLAVIALQRAVKENPRDAAAVRDLGIAHFKKNNLQMALKYLQAALRLNPKEALTLFYIGAVQEEQGDLMAAIKTYSRYLGTEGAEARAAMKSRLAQLVRLRLQQDARTALAQEAQLSSVAPRPNSLAVLYFRNLGSNRDLDPLQKGLADMLITDLSQIQSLRVVERLRLQSLLEEMGLGMAGLVDEATAPRVGRLLGVRDLINGAFLDLTGEQIRIDAGLFQSTGDSVISEALSGPLQNVFRLEKDLAFNVLDRLGITPTLAERDAIMRIPTENLLAFLTYSKGLDYEDRGLLQEAEKSYQEAVRLDPKFQKAKQHTTRVRSMSAFPPQLRAAEKLLARRPVQSRPVGAVPRSIPPRLLLTATNTGAHIGRLTSVLDDKTRTSNLRQPAVEDVGSFGATGQILIRVPLPP